LLKWTNTEANIVILKCKFIKYYNNSYLNAFIQYHDVELRYYHDNYPEGQVNRRVQPPEGLAGTIIDTNNQIIKPNDFDNELYPYYRYKISDYRSPYIGLFRFLKIVKTVRNGQTIDDDVTDIRQLKFRPMRNKVYTNTDYSLLNNTLMWVYLERENFSIIPSLDKEKMLQTKAVDKYTERLPEDMSMVIKDYLGGKIKIKRKTQKKGGKKITKRKKLHSKSRKRRRKGRK
jgi:hypothetical protein